MKVDKIQAKTGRMLRDDNKAVNVAHAYDPQDEMVKIKSMQKKFRDSFSGASLDTSKWESSVGAGGAISQASSILTIGSGTTINAITSILSKEVFTIPIRLSIGLTLSQRIANQSFNVELVSVDKDTLVPDGKHSVGIVFDGTSAIQAKYSVQNGGLAPLVSAASTMPTTSSNGLYEIEPFADEAWFHGGTMDSAVARTNSYRRHQQIPDPNALYKVRLRWVNGGTAPASNTNALVQFLAVQDYAELTAEITAGRGQTTAGQALGVNVVTMPTVTNTPTAPTPHTLNSAATTNATSVKTSAGTITGMVASNTSASARYLKIYNKASAPTVGTDIPVLTVPLPAGSLTPINPGVLGIRLATGIAYAITAGAADNDTAVIGAGEVKVITQYL